MANEKTEAMVKYDGKAVMDFLQDNVPMEWTPPIVKIDIDHKGGKFTSESFEGTNDEIKGIILSAHSVRTFWGLGDDPIVSGFTKLPLCASKGENFNKFGMLPNLPTDDMPAVVKALLNPIMDCNMTCKKCHYAEFGSAVSSKGQACKVSTWILIYNPDTYKYGWFSMSVSSLKTWQQYLGALGGRHYSRVVTKFSLLKQTRGVSKWSVVQFMAIEDVTPDMMQPLSKIVNYNGEDMMEVKAVISSFANIDIDETVETNAPTDGVKNGDDF